MKKRAWAVLLSVVVLANVCSCSKAESKNTAAAAEETNASLSSEEEAEAASSDDEVSSESMDYATGRPWINSNIESNVENASDTEIRDHLDLAVNGEWVKNHKIKSGSPTYAYIASFEDTLNERLLGIIETAAASEDHNARLVSQLYHDFVDWEARDAAGTAPLLPYLQEIEAIGSGEDLAAYITKPGYRFSKVLEMSVMTNPKDSSSKVLAISSPEFYLSDPADYEDLEHMSDYTKLSYDCEKENVTTVLTQCGYTDEEAEQIFKGAIQYEKKAAALSYSRDEASLTDTMDTLAAQIYTPEALKKYRWYSLVEKSLEAYGIKSIPAVELYEKLDYFEHLDELLSEDNIELIKDYLLAHTASEAILRLDEKTYYKARDIENKQYGSEGYRTEDEYAVGVVSSELGWPLSRLYCDQYVAEQDKQNIYKLIEEIVAAYKDMLREEDFLSEATREKAIEKLDKLRIHCMYPDDWSEYSYDDLELSDSYLDAIAEIEQYKAEKELSKLNEPVDHDKWLEEPILQNAFYLPDSNAINIMPGLIGDVLYRSDMPEEEMYGKVGVIIGHEISHAFDASGAAYDADGNRVDWWTAEDKVRFKEKTDQLVAYYDKISVWDGFSCSGELVKGEACADMGAVAVLLRLAAKNPDFDYPVFFKSYARLWAANSTPEYAYYVGTYDVHPLDYLRVNVTAAQFSEFYAAFDVQEGDGMYIAPEDRVKIW